MTSTPQGADSPPSPRSGTASGGRERPWWGVTDAVLAIPWFAISMIVAGLVSAIAIAIGGESLDAAETPVYALFFGVLSFQIAQATYPWLVSKYKGLGIGPDWRFVWSLPQDLYIGFGMAILCFAGAWISTTVVSNVVGLADPGDASNTDILVDNKGSLWLIGVIALVTIGAPLAEELLFRGLILRTLQKAYGSVIAVVISSFMFALPHWQPGATWRETAVLLSALAVVGAVFAIGAVKTNRLGPAVIAHFLFNGTSTIITLAL